MTKPWQYYCPIPLDPSHDRGMEFAELVDAVYLTMREYRKLATAVLRHVGFLDGTRDEDVMAFVMYCGMIADSTWKPGTGKTRDGWRFWKARLCALDVLRHRRRTGLTRKAKMDCKTMSISSREIMSRETTIGEIDLVDLISRAGLDEEERLMVKRLVDGNSLAEIARLMGTTTRQARYVRDRARRKIRERLCDAK